MSVMQESGRRESVTGGSVLGEPGRRDLVNALNEEWHQLGPGHRDVVQSWARGEVALDGCRTAADVLARSQHRPDEVLGVLIALDHEGVGLAGRIVLQAMLGKMVVMACRDPQAGVDDYVTQLWCRVRSYPLAERPHRIAANLALDTLKAVHAERGGRASATGKRVVPCVPLDLSEAEPPSAPVDLSAVRVLRAANELGLIDDPTHRLLVAVYAGGWSGKEVADHRRSATPLCGSGAAGRSGRWLARP